MDRIFYWFLLVLLACRMDAQAQQNAPGQLDKPYVILISLDGFRYDYVDRFQPPNLLEFIREGVAAESLIPSYPTKTFPNHYTIATGMTPEHHGLVANTFIDPDRGQMYRIGDRKAVEDGTWYGGTPLWVLAEQHGMVAASYFFVGSEADIQGMRPSFYFPYQHTTPNRKRVEQVLQWLALPEEERPHLITMYFSTMDDVGHRVGPRDEAALSGALVELDMELGELFKGVAQTGLPVHIILVSDHGMQEVPAEQMIPRELLENDDLYELADNGAFALVYLKEPGLKEAAFQYLKEREKNFTVYRRDDFPYYDREKASKRLGDLIILPDFPYYFKSTRAIGMAKMSKGERGEHGFPPEHQAMHAIFYARGPGLKKGIKIPSFQNTHVYPMICNLLGLPIPEDIDGDASVLMPIFRQEKE